MICRLLQVDGAIYIWVFHRYRADDLTLAFAWKVAKVARTHCENRARYSEKSLKGSSIDPRLSATICSFNINLANLESSSSELKWQPQVYEDYAKKRPTLYEGHYNLPLKHNFGVDVTTIDKNCDIFSSFSSETTGSKAGEMEAITELDLNLFELLEAASVQGVPGSEVMPNTTVSRQTLASTSSFASDDSYQSDSGSANPDSGFSCILDQFSDIGQLLAEHNQDNSSELQPSTVSEGRHGNYGALGSDEIMWNPSHSSSSPAIPTTALEPQTDTNDRASVSADMGNSPSPDRVHDSGPAAKRARLSSEESITSVLNDLERKREKNNEACRRARQNKRAKELEMKEKAQTLEKENEKLRKTIAKLEKKVSEEKARFLKAMTTS